MLAWLRIKLLQQLEFMDLLSLCQHVGVKAPTCLGIRLLRLTGYGLACNLQGPSEEMRSRELLVRTVCGFEPGVCQQDERDAREDEPSHYGTQVPQIVDPLRSLMAIESQAQNLMV